MKVNGKTIRLVGMENFTILMGIFLMGNGRMTRRMGMVYILEKMDHDMKDIGKMIFSMVKAQKHGMTEVAMLGNIKKV